MSDKAYKDQEQKAAEADVEAFQRRPWPLRGRGGYDAHADGIHRRQEARQSDHLRQQRVPQADRIRPRRAAGAKLQLPAREPGRPQRPGRGGEAAFAGKEDCADIRYRRKDGSTFCATIFVNPVKDKDGKIYEHFLSLVDTTRHEQAREHAAMLIDELNHRVKNTLATVQSIVIQAVRNSSDPKIIAKSIETRIAALSRSHDLLGREKWEGAGLRDLVREIACAVHRDRRPRRAVHDRGRKSPVVAQGRVGAGHRVQRTGDQCRQIWRFFQRSRYDRHQVGSRSTARWPLAIPPLAREGRASR